MLQLVTQKPKSLLHQYVCTCMYVHILCIVQISKCAKLRSKHKRIQTNEHLTSWCRYHGGIFIARILA